MIARLTAISLLLFLCLAQAGHAKDAEDKITPNEFRSKNGGRIWVYLPKAISSETKIACILVPPAGSRLFHGMSLADGDQLEHLPYVSAGFAVVSFDISGPWPSENQIAAQRKAITNFLNSKCGVSDGLEALELALSKYPQIDPQRIYVAGHSSAGTLSLQLAAASDKFRGCVAFAPITDLEGRFGARGIAALEQAFPGISKALLSASPSKNIDGLKCPLYLFHATDDNNVRPASVIAYRDALREHKKSVEYVSVDSGGHYDSMINPGIPKAILWLKALDQKKK